MQKEHICCFLTIGNRVQGLLPLPASCVSFLVFISILGASDWVFVFNTRWNGVVTAWAIASAIEDLTALEIALHKPNWSGKKVGAGGEWGFSPWCLGLDMDSGFICSPGFSGILREDGTLQNEVSCQRLAEVALAYAKAGECWIQIYRYRYIDDNVCINRNTALSNKYHKETFTGSGQKSMWHSILLPTVTSKMPWKTCTRGTEVKALPCTCHLSYTVPELGRSI